MGGSVIFYTYGSTLELNGQQLTAGMLTADLLNLSPDEYMRLKKRMTQITDLAKEYERKRDIALWWKLNEKMDALCQKLRRYQVFRLLLDEDEDAFFSAIREITGQFDLFPKEEHAKTILDDLCGEGALEFLTRIQSREYDENRAVLTTYLYPHLKGRMTRWLEQNLGCMALSKDEMAAVRQVQRLYHVA